MWWHLLFKDIEIHIYYRDFSVLRGIARVEMMAASPATKNVMTRAVMTFSSSPELIQTIVNTIPVMMVINAAFPWYRFQKRESKMTTEKVDPIPAQT